MECLAWLSYKCRQLEGTFPPHNRRVRRVKSTTRVRAARISRDIATGPVLINRQCEVMKMRADNNVHSMFFLCNKQQTAAICRRGVEVSRAFEIQTFVYACLSGRTTASNINRYNIAREARAQRRIYVQAGCPTTCTSCICCSRASINRTPAKTVCHTIARVARVFEGAHISASHQVHATTSEYMFVRRVRIRRM